ncbi:MULTISPECIES: alpha/beta fold hydrolase [unclassified Streptomyces]|uniref:alpha/beta fold hydrolase n=1 Tax=unclassified Streptomyces TaxID=2593676 RepID=UPI002E76C60B|nr:MULTISPECIES: alpha/beta hydrolase [unclassified Streptomyces]MEE1759534.1 alpha/beta hydrolase [Streptomyces sp. SP18BB07]MEE1833441.1 alpha/beta hydrolase [Streptomyces sp. SP17KL33]
MSRPPSFTPPPGARAHRLRTPRGEFAVIEAGVAVKGSVLLVPGFTGSKEDFIALHEPLAAAGYRTVAVDGRGQYESPGAEDDEAPYAQPELAKDLLAQARSVGDGGPLHLVGHSLGGQISRAAVLMDASPFASLTLMASGPAQISVGQQQRVKLLRDALAVMDMEQVWDAIQAMEAPEPEEADTGALDAGLDDRADLRRRWLATKPAQLIATGRQLCSEPDRVAELAAVDLPKHVLSGERDDTWPIPILDDMAVRLRAHRTVVRDAEHSPNTDQPKATADALIGFWDRIVR